MSGGGSDGEPARRHVPSVGPCDGVDGGDAGRQEDGEQDHQEDEGGKQHGFYLLFFDWVGLWCLLIRGLAGGSGMLRCVRRENLAAPPAARRRRQTTKLRRIVVFRRQSRCGLYAGRKALLDRGPAIYMGGLGPGLFVIPLRGA